MEVSKSISSNGYFVFTYVKGDTDWVGSHWAYPKCVPYTESFMKNVSEQNGLYLFEIEPPVPSGQTWSIATPIANKNSIAYLESSTLQDINNRLVYYRQRLNMLENTGFIRFYLAVKTYATKIKMKIKGQA